MVKHKSKNGRCDRGQAIGILKKLGRKTGTAILPFDSINIANIRSLADQFPERDILDVAYEHRAMFEIL